MTCCSCIGVSSIPLCCSFVVKFWFFSYFVPSLFWQNHHQTWFKYDEDFVQSMRSQTARSLHLHFQLICVQEMHLSKFLASIYMYTLCMIWKSIYDRSLLVSFKQDFCFLDKQPVPLTWSIIHHKGLMMFEVLINWCFLQQIIHGNHWLIIHV